MGEDADVTSNLPLRELLSIRVVSLSAPGLNVISLLNFRGMADGMSPLRSERLKYELQPASSLDACDLPFRSK